MSSILVVDDDKTSLKIMVERVKAGGYDVVGISDSQEALVFVEQNDIKVVITDIMMPEKDGLELIAGLIKANPDAKVIAVSQAEEVDASYMDAAKQLGAAYTFSKEDMLYPDLFDAIDALIVRD